MDYILTVNILKLINNLFCEKSTNFFSHVSHLFAKVEQELTLDVFHNDVHLARDVPLVVLDDAIVAILVHLDDSLVFEGAQNFYLFADAVARIF